MNNKTIDISDVTISVTAKKGAKYDGVQFFKSVRIESESDLPYEAFVEIAKQIKPSIIVQEKVLE